MSDQLPYPKTRLVRCISCGTHPVWNTQQKCSNCQAHLRNAPGGKTGSIPRWMLERRFERTPIDEDPDQVHYFQRNIAKDFRPDPVLFESDMVTTSRATNAGLLNLRLYGQLGTAEPDRPDMFLGFTDRDPRGTAPDPDFSKYTDDSWKRAKRTVMSLNPDKSEDTITGGGLSGQGHDRVRQEMFRETQKRLRYFQPQLETTFGAGRTLAPKNPYEQRARIADYEIESPDNYMASVINTPSHNQYYSMTVNPELFQNDQHYAETTYGENRSAVYLSDIGGAWRNGLVGVDQKTFNDSTGYNLAPGKNVTLDIGKLKGMNKFQHHDQKAQESMYGDPLIAGAHSGHGSHTDPLSMMNTTTIDQDHKESMYGGGTMGYGLHVDPLVIGGAVNNVVSTDGVRSNHIGNVTDMGRARYDAHPSYNHNGMMSMHDSRSKNMEKSGFTNRHTELPDRITYHDATDTELAMNHRDNLSSSYRGSGSLGTHNGQDMFDASETTGEFANSYDTPHRSTAELKSEHSMRKVDHAQDRREMSDNHGQYHGSGLHKFKPLNGRFGNTQTYGQERMGERVVDDDRQMTNAIDDGRQITHAMDRGKTGSEIIRDHSNSVLSGRSHQMSAERKGYGLTNRIQKITSRRNAKGRSMVANRTQLSG